MPRDRGPVRPPPPVSHWPSGGSERGGVGPCKGGPAFRVYRALQTPQFDLNLCTREISLFPSSYSFPGLCCASSFVSATRCVLDILRLYFSPSLSSLLCISADRSWYVNDRHRAVSCITGSSWGSSEGGTDADARRSSTSSVSVPPSCPAPLRIHHPPCLFLLAATCR